MAWDYDRFRQEPGLPNKAAGAPFSWIAQNFVVCPPDLPEESEIVQQHCQAYVRYVLSRVLFSDGTGVNAPFMWLQMLACLDFGLSWGSAALAYLYHQAYLTSCFIIVVWLTRYFYHICAKVLIILLV